LEQKMADLSEWTHERKNLKTSFMIKMNPLLLVIIRYGLYTKTAKAEYGSELFQKGYACLINCVKNFLS
jgi:hypothetical protein